MRPRARLAVATAALTAVVVSVLLVGGPVALVSTFGDSMLPAYRPQELVVVVEHSGYQVGDVVAYRSADLRQTVLHRIVDRDGDRFLLQGDNNDWLDPERPASRDVIGRAVLSIPHAGRLVDVPRPVMLTALVLGVAMVLLTSRSRPSRSHLLAGPTEALPLDAGRRLAAVAGAAALAFALVGGVAQLRTSTDASPAEATYEHRGRFSYEATVPRSPVYPDGNVGAGDTVFLRLVEAVDVSFDYEFHADDVHQISGRADWVVEVSDGSGWTRQLPLDGEATIEGGTATLTAALDVAAVQRLVDEVQAQTGVESTARTLVLVPNVDVEGTLAGQAVEDRFAPELRFSLDQLRLQPQAADAEGEDALTPVESGTVVLPGVSAASVALLGWDAPATAVRKICVIGAGLSLLLALAGWAAQRANDRHARPVDRDRARHRRLLVAVDDLVVPGDRTVVDLTSLDALAALAQRYERVILHHRSPDGDTYAVEHDGILHRFRHSTAAGLGAVDVDTSDQVTWSGPNGPEPQLVDPSGGATGR